MDALGILTNIAQSLLPVQKLITGGAYLIGIAFSVKALLVLKSHGESKASMSSSSSLKEPLLYFIVSAVFIYFPTGFEMLMNTTFGYSTVLSYSTETAMAAWLGTNSELGAALTVIVQTIGLYAFVRGWIMIVKSSSTGQPPNGTGKGLTHVFGGILAINIVGTIEMINNTLMGTG
jgi:intracellular multiplication protein IcmC